MLPAFNQEGNLPEGIHLATEDEVFVWFATPSARRQWLGDQLRSLLALAKSTGQLPDVFLWGSFVTSKEVPNDLDVLLVMGTEFSTGAVPSLHTSCLTTSKRASVSRRMSFGPKPPLGHRSCTCGWTPTKRGRILRGAGLSR
jgi:hypothetical protein